MNWIEDLSSTGIMGLIVVGLLLVASCIVQLLKWRKPEGDFTELATRIRSWWFMAGFFFFSLLVHKDASLVLFMCMSFLALKEYFSLVHTRVEDHRALFWSYIAIPIQYWWVKCEWTILFYIFIPVFMFLLLPFRLILAGQPKGMIKSMATIQWGLMAFVFCISHVAFMMNLPETPDITGGGRALVLYLVFLTEMNDVSQYIWGKLFGKHSIAPNISPKKTTEGFIGGVLTTVVLAILLRFLSGFSIPFAIASGLIISCSGFVGDLVMSAVKRDLGVKDASQLIPGHGGILDRVDSLTYTAPLFFHFTAYCFY